MIRFSLRCEQAHRFDSWFGSGADFDRLLDSGLIACAVCGSTAVEKDLMTPSIAGSPAEREPLGGIAAAEAEPAAAEADGQLRMKDIIVDVRRMSVHLAGRRIELTKTEFDLLTTLIRSGGAVLTRQEMMEQVWGENYFGGSNSIDVHIKSLRQKLGDDPRSPRYIVTVRGVGYLLAREA